MDKNTEDLAWGIGIVILLITLWVTSGGIQRSSKEIVNPGVKGGNNPTVAVKQNQQPFFSQFYTYSPQLPEFNSGQTYWVVPDAGGSGSSGSGSSQGSQPYYSYPENIAKSDLSPHAGKVNLSMSSAGSAKPENEYVTIEASPQLKTRINITGWTLISEKSGARSSIGQGTGLPYLNQGYGKEDIYLVAGDRAYIITGRSPINMSFRPNSCTGYFQQFRVFNPYLPSSCPLIKDAPFPPAPNNFNDACEDFINGYPSCTEVTKPLPSFLTHECQVFITEEARYDKCVDRNKNTPDFYKKEWRVYLSRDASLWKNRRETIKLLDQNQKVVDVITY